MIAVAKNLRTPTHNIDVWQRLKRLPKPVFWLPFSRYEIFQGKSFKKVLGTLFPTEMVLLIFAVRRFFTSKMVMSPKNHFSQLFWKISFFRKNCSIKNI